MATPPDYLNPPKYIAYIGRPIYLALNSGSTQKIADIAE